MDFLLLYDWECNAWSRVIYEIFLWIDCLGQVFDIDYVMFAYTSCFIRLKNHFFMHLDTTLDKSSSSLILDQSIRLQRQNLGFSRYLFNSFPIHQAYFLKNFSARYLFNTWSIHREFLHQKLSRYVLIPSWSIKNAKLVFWDKLGRCKIPYTCNHLFLTNKFFRSNDLKFTQWGFFLRRFSLFVNKLPCQI